MGTVILVSLFLKKKAVLTRMLTRTNAIMQ
jgi:hypothetical protein